MYHRRAPFQNKAVRLQLERLDIKRASSHAFASAVFCPRSIYCVHTLLRLHDLVVRHSRFRDVTWTLPTDARQANSEITL
jgi:hypothetical protein